MCFSYPYFLRGGEGEREETDDDDGGGGDDHHDDDDETGNRDNLSYQR